VRDRLLGRGGAHDLDLATNAKPSEVLTIVRGWADQVWLQGVKFGTVGALIQGQHVEITTYREEWYEPDSRKPQVQFARDITSDLSRRDFTVNAIAVRTPTGEVYDPFGGIQDLARKVLRTPRSPEQAFTDDPLRMLRACRFAATLDAEIAEEVLAAMRTMRERLDIVSRERVGDELSKLVCGVRPSRGLQAMVDTGLAAHVIPELPQLAMEQDPIHRHKDVLAHTFAVVEKVPPDLVTRLGALLHDIGKPATREFGPEGVTFHHHEAVGAKMARARLRELGFERSTVKDVAELVRLSGRFKGYADGWSDSAVRRYTRDAGHLLGQLNELVRCDCTTRNRAKAERLQRQIDELEERIVALARDDRRAAERPQLDGRAVMDRLGIDAGPDVGAALQFLLDLKRTDGILPVDEVEARLDGWWKDRTAN
jgi:poly(A) polymerase